MSKRCTRCGAEIPDDLMFCPECGAEVQMVPDYNPLEDFLAREVRGSVEGATRKIQKDDLKRYRRDPIETQGENKENFTRVISQEDLRRAQAGRSRSSNSASGTARGTGDTGVQRSSGGVRGSTGQYASGASGRISGSVRRDPSDTGIRQTGTGRSTTSGMYTSGRISGSAHGTSGTASSAGSLRSDEAREAARQREQRRIQQERRLAKAKRKRRNLLLILAAFVCLIAAGVYIAYQNSYAAMIKKGDAALADKEYTKATEYYNRAIIKDKSKAEAYTGLANVYLEQDDSDNAELVFLTALETQPTNSALYEAAIAFYVDTEQVSKISALLENCEDSSVLKAVSDYVSAAPQFSLDEGEYDEVQEVSLTSETGGTIYYTTDGTDPTEESTKYTEAILIQEEGETEIRAIAVNEAGIPSTVASAVYTIEFPIADAPAVTPSTGQYESGEVITVTVPDGYTAYYTLDGTTPTEESEEYTGPVEMPEDAQTIFTAILINNSSGKATAVTTRTYITTTD